MRRLPLLLTISLAACGKPVVQPPAQHSAVPRDVSIIQILAEPEKFDGQEVRVVGYLHVEFESFALWLHKEDWSHRLLANSIKVAADTCGGQLNRVNDTYVLLEARLVVQQPRPGYSYPVLLNSTRCQPWSK